MTTLHDFEIRLLDGTPTKLADFAGKTVLLVNVASRCGLTPQYAGLEALHRELSGRGFSVLGFPCNQFGGQEPGSAEEIRGFCATNYDVSFPLFEKIDVNGNQRHPLYAWLTSENSSPDGPGDIAWNFAKFVVNGDGKLVARFSPMTAPDAPELRRAIEEALPR